MHCDVPLEAIQLSVAEVKFRALNFSWLGTVYEMTAWLALFHDVHTLLLQVPGMSNTLLLTTTPSAHEISVPFSASERLLIVATDVSVELFLAVNLAAMLSVISTGLLGGSLYLR